jgi:hypothetical protein
VFVDDERSVEEFLVSTSGEERVVMMVAVFPWAASVLERAQYIQLDATFKSARPYVLSVPLAIIDNEAFPVGFAIAPTERQELYCLFDDFICDEMQIPRHRELPILSDRGKALVAYGQRTPQRPHFFCYRHLIEDFGSGTFVAQIVRRLLFTSTEEEYKSIVEQAFADFDELERNSLTENGSDRFHDLFGREVDESVDTLGSNALWIRARLGASTRSNNVERLHKELNRQTAGLPTLLRRLRLITDTLVARYAAACSFDHRSGTELARKFALTNAKKPDRCPYGPTCGWSRIYEQRFGLAGFPCPQQKADPDRFRWRRPIDPPLQGLPSPNWDMARYGGKKWTFPENEPEDRGTIPEAEAFRGEDASFLHAVARECQRLHPDSPPLDVLQIAIGIEWGLYDEVYKAETQEHSQLIAQNTLQTDAWKKTAEKRFLASQKAKFRIKVWAKARKKELQIAFLD